MKTLLLSYPRSGNSWCRYILESLTGRPTTGLPRLIHPWTGNAESHYFGDDEFDDDVIIKLHGDPTEVLPESKLGETPLIQKYFNKGYALILLIRDPIEAITRHEGHHARGFGHPDYYYFKNIKLFDSYNGLKTVVYYEDLIQNPKAFMRELGVFMGVENYDQKVESFMDDFESHREASRQFYSAAIAPPRTSGKPDSIKFHSSGYSQDYLKIQWAKITQHQDPEVLKYIERYRVS
jgi:hypothetical protein